VEQFSDELSTGVKRKDLGNTRKSHRSVLRPEKESSPPNKPHLATENKPSEITRTQSIRQGGVPTLQLPILLPGLSGLVTAALRESSPADHFDRAPRSAYVLQKSATFDSRNGNISRPRRRFGWQKSATFDFCASGVAKVVFAARIMALIRPIP
jgi:hypothetical protein